MMDSGTFVAARTGVLRGRSGVLALHPGSFRNVGFSETDAHQRQSDCSMVADSGFTRSSARIFAVPGDI